MIDPGEMDTRVAIEQTVETKNAHQETVSAWTLFLPRWIKLEALSGRELFAYEQVQGLTMFKATMRYAAGLTTKMRVRYGQRHLNIVAAFDPDARQVWHILHLTEAV